MDTNSLSIQFIPDTSITSDSVWLNMEQVDIPRTEAYANFEDIYQMFIRASTGISAKTYSKSDCPIEVTSDGKIQVPLDFYVYPSDESLPYSLSLNSGTIINREEVLVEKEGNVIVKKSDTASLPFLANITSAIFETDVYNKFGVSIKHPEIKFTKNYFYFDQSIFAVIRIKCYAIAHKYTALLSFDKTIEGIDQINSIVDQQKSNQEELPQSPLILPASGYDQRYLFSIESEESAVTEETTAEEGTAETAFAKITNVNTVVSAKYVDEKGEEQTTSLELEVPECVLSALELCPGDSNEVIFAGKVSFDKKTPVLYYSTCTGNPLLLVYE